MGLSSHQILCKTLYLEPFSATGVIVRVQETSLKGFMMKNWEPYNLFVINDVL